MISLFFTFLMLVFGMQPPSPGAVLLVPPPPEMCAMGMAMAEMQAQEPGQEEPPTSGNPEHKEPTEFCTPHNRPDGKVPCMCVMKNPEGCKAGHREEETSLCNSWCWKDLCHCCSS